MPTEENPISKNEPEDATEEYYFDELSKGLAQGTITRGRAMKLGGAAILGSLLSIFALPEIAEAKKKRKVTLCHNGQTIRVSRRARKAHRRHGDTLGPCPPPPPTSASPFIGGELLLGWGPVSARCVRLSSRVRSACLPQAK